MTKISKREKDIFVFDKKAGRGKRTSLFLYFFFLHKNKMLFMLIIALHLIKCLRMPGYYILEINDLHMLMI